MKEALSKVEVHRVYNSDDVITQLPPHLRHYGIPHRLTADEEQNLVESHISTTYERLILDSWNNTYEWPPTRDSSATVADPQN
jgi:hypothetical protein